MKIKWFSFVIACFFSLSVQSQISETNDSGFADYLFNLKLYDFASEEYERLWYENPNELKHLKNLIKSYRFSGKQDFLKNRLDHAHLSDPEVLQTYFKLLLTQGYTDDANQLLNQKALQFESTQSNELKFQLALATNQWNQAIQAFDKPFDKAPYNELIGSIKNRNYKSPTKAAFLSALIPGTGRFYAKDYKDGIISMIFIGSTAFQSYRRFDQNGIKSTGGWIYGSIALGFYISNIYGSYQAAKYYNNKIDTRLHEKSLYYINADIDL